MSIRMVDAARASTPYPWAKFARWQAEQQLDAEEFQTMLENGAEPTAYITDGVLDTAPYPGLPSLEGLTLEAEPTIKALGGTP